MLSKLFNWICSLCGCENYVDLSPGMNVVKRIGRQESVEKVFKPLVDAGVLEVVRYQNEAGRITEFHFSSYVTPPRWINDIGDVYPKKNYFIKVKAAYPRFKF